MAGGSAVAKYRPRSSIPTMSMSGVSLKAQGTLLHRQLFLTLKQQIVNGVYREGDRLPTQEALTERFKVSRITVRRALSELQSEGWIQNEQGVGSFVLPIKRPRPAAVSLTYLEGLRQVASETQVTVLHVGVETPPPDVARILELEEGGPALHVVRIRRRGRIPLLLLDAWMPPRFAPRVSSAQLRRRPLFELLIGEDLSLGEVVQEVTAEMAEPTTAEALAVEINSPILRITRLVHDNEQRPIQHLVIRSTPQRSRMVMSVPGKQLNTIGTGHLVHDVG